MRTSRPKDRRRPAGSGPVCRRCRSDSRTRLQHHRSPRCPRADEAASARVHRRAGRAGVSALLHSARATRGSEQPLAAQREPQARAVHAGLFDPMRTPLQRGQVAPQPHPHAGVCRQPRGRQPEASPHADARRQPGRVRRGKADQAAQQPTSIARRRRKIVVDDQRAGVRLNRRCACGQASSRVPSAPRRWPQRPASTWPARGGCRRWRRA